MFSRIRWGCVILEAGVNGQADALATHNVRDFEPATRLFGLRVQRSRVVSSMASAGRRSARR